ncbi:tRNA synthetase beta subunit family protein [Artemisia annua]|uniref:phenylalanine--tRNA ligase n=1 Tax=Artemisia annua TaxID=35608 RepID=A0A2U1N640_ARTAN|nr:tRNA synthetase beta subunit family protein [Artemisia annua]
MVEVSLRVIGKLVYVSVSVSSASGFHALPTTKGVILYRNYTHLPFALTKTNFTNRMHTAAVSVKAEMTSSDHNTKSESFKSSLALPFEYNILLLLLCLCELLIVRRKDLRLQLFGPSCQQLAVGRDLLFQALGRTYKEFDELCFVFVIELDDVTTEKAIIRKEKHLTEEEEIGGEEDIIYKIDGLVQSLRIFCGIDSVPNYTLADVSKKSMIKMHVKPETSAIRPFVVCAVLRGITFDEARYNSFIDLQDKLHQNICRRRTLVAIGTHDLDKIEGPFTYEALPPKDIEFVPLKQVIVALFGLTSAYLHTSWKLSKLISLMEFYKSDLKLKKYLHIIEKSPVYPVIYDRNRTVLSLPSIINGAHLAISLKTKNVFIECTSTDLTKAKIVLNTMVTMFSVYCERKFEVEPVEVIDSDGKSDIYPELSPYHMKVVRNSLMAGILKTVAHNKDHPKPIKLIHGLVDRVMEVTGNPFVLPGDNTGYYIELTKDPEYLEGRQASIIYKGKRIGTFGIVHRQVLENFGIPDPCSFVELNIESLL